jgi:hypothetical protein
MNRRDAIKATFSVATGAAVLRAGSLFAQQPDAPTTTTAADTIYLNPATGADTNSGAKDSPLKTLVEAARRVNKADGTGPMTVILSEGVYSVGETATFKPTRRSFTKSERLTIRAEVLPDDPDWLVSSGHSLSHARGARRCVASRARGGHRT